MCDEAEEAGAVVHRATETEREAQGSPVHPWMERPASRTGRSHTAAASYSSPRRPTSCIPPVASPGGGALPSELVTDHENVGDEMTSSPPCPLMRVHAAYPTQHPHPGHHKYPPPPHSSVDQGAPKSNGPCLCFCIQGQTWQGPASGEQALGLSTCRSAPKWAALIQQKGKPGWRSLGPTLPHTLKQSGGHPDPQGGDSIHGCISPAMSSPELLPPSPTPPRSYSWVPSSS